MNGPAVQLAQTLDDSEPQARSLAADVLAAVVPFENMLQFFFRDARTGVLDPDTTVANPDHHLAFRRVTHGIADQVSDRDRHDRLRCDDADPILLDNPEYQRLVTDQRFVEVNHVLHDLPDIVGTAVLVDTLLGAYKVYAGARLIDVNLNTTLLA